MHATTKQIRKFIAKLMVAKLGWRIFKCEILLFEYSLPSAQGDGTIDSIDPKYSHEFSQLSIFHNIYRQGHDVENRNFKTFTTRKDNCSGNIPLYNYTTSAIIDDLGVS